MGYSLEPLQDGCYENSNVLINKFDIKDEQELEMMERNLTSYLMAQATIEIPFQNVDFEFYKNLHKYIFNEIYDWAGTIRKVDMSKSGTQFCPAEKIEERAKIIFDRLNDQRYFQGAYKILTLNYNTSGLSYCFTNHLLG
ncbi:MAG: Fic family protein [Clostridia bacterium]|nr:Fic family protein [Clostridia bacterium]